MSPSAVSRAVARLEDDLGIRLLQRTTRSLTLTEDGTMFYQRCQQILDDLEAVELEVNQSQSKPKGTLRLNFSIAFGKMYIAPRLAELAAQYPELTFNVSFSDRLSDLIEEGMDATVRVGAGSDRRLVMQVLGTADSITCAAPSYLAQAGVPILSCRSRGGRLLGSLKWISSPWRCQWRVICYLIMRRRYWRRRSRGQD
jgi:LysR family transcriptional regulator, regulator for bpeEF and oprC